VKVIIVLGIASSQDTMCYKAINVSLSQLYCSINVNAISSISTFS